MSVTGNVGDTNFVIEIPLSYLGCTSYYWAMNVEADFAGTSGSSQYRYTTGWGWGAITYEEVVKDDPIVILDESEGFYLTGADFGVMSQWIYLGVLGPGEKLLVSQSYHLDGSVDNWGQSDKVTFDMDFVAQQIEGALPDPPGDVLPGHDRLN